MSGVKPNSVRVAISNWQSEERFERLLDIIDKYDCGIEDIVLFTSFTHAPLTLEELKRRVDIISVRMQRARKRGYRAGINILATIGHHNEDLDNSFQGKYYRMTGSDGTICEGSFCMSDENYINDYVIPSYIILAKSSPDFIWIDDDVRYGHMPIGHGCFCDNCIRIFNEKNKTKYNREDLVKELENGNIELRQSFLNKNGELIENIFRIISNTVRKINSNITLGFMTGDRFFEGYSFEKFAVALSENGKHQIMWRPGGGAYDDKCFDLFIDKADTIGRQCANLPDYVTKIQSEIESFPYEVITKTPHSTAMEMLLYNVAGCNGTALNILPSASGIGAEDEPLELIENHLKKLEESYEFEKLLNKKIGNLTPCGIHTGWHPKSQITVSDKKWSQTLPNSSVCNIADEILSLGLPVCYNIENADVVVLNNNAAAVFDDNEIEKLLSKGIYMNSKSLEYINSRGFGNKTGFSAGEEYPVDAHERYLDHKLNEGFVGGTRNCRQAFYPGESVSLVSTQEKAQSLSDLIDYQGNILAKCSLGIYENSLGGRICCGGYYPFSRVSFYSKSLQIKNIFNYLSKDKLVAYVKSHERIRIWTYKSEDRAYAVLFNMTNDTQNNIELAVNSGCDYANVYDRVHGEQFAKTQIKESRGEKTVCIKKLPPYEMVLIEL